MERRSFVIGALATLTAPRIAVAQQLKRIPRVGVILAHLMPNSFMD